MPHFLCPFVCCFHALAVVNNAALNKEHRYLFQILFSLPLGVHPERDSQFLWQFCFKFGGKPPYHFYSSYTSLHSHQQCTSVPLSPNPPRLVISCVFDDNHSAMYVVLICIYLIISDIKHFFIYLLVICISSLEKCLFNSSAYFKRIIWNCSENCSHFDISYKASLLVMNFFSFYLLVKVCLVSEEQIWLV